MSSLSDAERQEVEQMAAVHREIADEIRHVEESLKEYAFGHARNPRPALRAEIMEAISELPGARRNPVIPMRAASSPAYRLWIAATVVILLLSSAAIAFLYHKWQSSEDKYAALENEKNVLTQNYDVVKTAYEHASSDMNIMRNEHAKMVTLMPIDSTKHFMARVYWDHDTHHAYVDVLELPVPASGKQYQLWALVGGKPVDAGVFNVNDHPGMQQVKPVMQADAWAVTLEPMGGSAVPTMSQMYLLSKS